MGRPKKDRTGQNIVLKNGQTATIIAYRGAQDLDIQFENGCVFKGVTYRQLQRWARRKTTRNKRCQSGHLGEAIALKNGTAAIIIAYRSINDIDVQFSNGVIKRHLQYGNFKRGSISWHQYDNERIGEQRVMKNGQLATIVAYRNCRDVDVQFADGSVHCHVRYDRFVKCTRPHEEVAKQQQESIHVDETSV